MCVLTASTNPLPLETSESLQERESHLQIVWWGCWKCDRDCPNVPSVFGALLLYHRSDGPIIPQTSRLVGSPWLAQGEHPLCLSFPACKCTAALAGNLPSNLLLMHCQGSMF